MRTGDEMSEAIKGQNKLKLTVEKLEVELFKDWPKKSGSNNSIGFLVVGDEPCLIVGGCWISTDGRGVIATGEELK